MSFAQEIKDFTSGFTQGYKIYSEAQTAAETKRYHEALEAHWNATPASAADQAAKAIAAEGESRAAKVGAGGAAGGGGNKPTLTPEILNDKDQLKTFIRQAEAHGDYGALVYKNNGDPGGSKDFSNMTVDQVLAFQKGMTSNGHASTALGGYQFTAPTLQGLVKTLGISGDTKFTNDLQDKLADELLRQRGYDDWKTKGGTPEKLLYNLSQEWASLPNPRTGVSFYEGDRAGNHATVGFGGGLLKTAPATSPAVAYGGPGEGAGRAGAPQPAGSQAVKPPPTPAIPPPAPSPSLATPAQPPPQQGATPRVEAPIPVPPSMLAQAPPSQTSPVELASATSPWAIPGQPNPMATFAQGGLVEPRPYTQARYDMGSPIAESVVPPNALNTYAIGGTVEATQLQAHVQNPLPGYQMGGTVAEPESEDTEGDTSPIPGFDPNTPLEVKGYTGKFTEAQAKAAQEGDPTTPGTDEYWAAARRQQKAAATPQQDPQLTASRPPGQAIPTTGTTAPGAPESPINPIDWIVHAIKSIPEAIHAGMMGLQQMLGLTAAVPSGAPVDPAAAQKLATGEGIKLSPAELKAVDQKVDPDDKLTPALKNVARLSAGYDYFKQKGDMVKANRYAGAMLATIQDSIRMKGVQAQLAGHNGDYAMLAKKLQEGHDLFPDGNTMKVSDVGKDGASYEIIGPDGRVSAQGRATVDDMMRLATGMADGTEFFKQAGYLGGMSTPQQIAKDKDDQAKADYANSPGAMTTGEQQWLAGKSDQQRDAINRMSWQARKTLYESETRENKLTDDQANEQEASRLTGIIQQAQQEYADARSQRTDPDQPTNIENAALAKLQASVKAAQDWAGAAPGRYKYIQHLGIGLTSSGKSGSTATAVAAGAIPPQAGTGRMTAKEREAAQEEAQTRAANKAERVGVLSQQQFDQEGRPIPSVNAKVAQQYGQVLNLQAVQKAYDDAGISGSPKQKDLESISKEISDQAAGYDKPELAPVKQRLGAVASVIMNSNDVTAHDAVGMTLAAIDRSVDKKGNPKTPIGITRDGRLRIGDYEPMIVNRQMLTMLANLQQQHEQAKAKAPTFPMPEERGPEVPGSTAETKKPISGFETLGPAAFERERAAAGIPPPPTAPTESEPAGIPFWQQTPRSSWQRMMEMERQRQAARRAARQAIPGP